MKEFKQNLVDLIVASSHTLKIISLKDVAAANGINHIDRQDVQDILNAVLKVLPGYHAVRMMNTPNDSLFQSLTFVQNDVTFDDGSEFEEQHIYLIESVRNGDTFGGDKPLSVDGREIAFDDEAIDVASDMWDALSDCDKARRDEFFLCDARADEDGCCDLDRARVIRDFVNE